MKPIIYCMENRRGTDTFYLETEAGRYYLFHQDYRSGVHDYFRKGVRLDEVYDFSRCKGNKAVIKTQTKIPMYIRYAESEYGIAVPEKTQRRMQRLRLVG